MPFQAVPDVAEFRIVQELRSEPVLNTIYVRNTLAAWTPTALQTTNAAIGNAWRDDVLPLVTSSLRLVSVDGRDIGVEFGQETQSLYGNVGADAAEELPANVACWVKFLGSAGAPPRRGGLFMAGLTVNDVASGEIDPAFNTAVVAALQAVRTALAAAVAGNAHVIVSRWVNKTKRATGVSNTVTALAVRTTVASQRDRRPGE
jgi:hypothetical protein